MKVDKIKKSFHLEHLQIYVLHAPTELPVETSFGVMHERPAVWLKVEDNEGAFGWGEVWCNFPSCGAEHRASLLRQVIGPLILGVRYEDPAELLTYLEEKTHILAIQSGEPGPIAQVIGGVDIAVCDMLARRSGLPLYGFLGGAGREFVPTYASGISPGKALYMVEQGRRQGFRAFKLKVGFEEKSDLNTIKTITRTLSPDEQYMLDANQAWDLESAKSMAGKIEPYAPAWLEEPLAADRPRGEWLELAENTSIPLAAGENLNSRQGFQAIIEEGVIQVVQPDVCKWGGVSGCLSAAKEALAKGRRYCPHFLGGCIGLAASAHLLAAVGGDGLLEVDVNPNPLREGDIITEEFIKSGRYIFNGKAGLGFEPDVRNAPGTIKIEKAALTVRDLKK